MKNNMKKLVTDPTLIGAVCLILSASIMAIH